MEKSKEIGRLWGELELFVKEVCGNRDESHSDKHMKAVAQLVIKIIKMMIKNDKTVKEGILRDAIIVAWLHDVIDHKYDHDSLLRNKVEVFLNDLVGDKKTPYILNIIDRISYSKENKIIKSGGELDWLNVLGEDGVFVRNIVSDADKLEALGLIGLNRCIMYSKEHYLEKHKKEIPLKLLKTRVHQHSKKKLLRLKDEFIRTDEGRELANSRHKEFVNALNEFLKE